MPFNLTGAGGLFPRLGKIFGIMEAINAFRGTTLPPKIDTLDGQYSSTDQNIPDSLYSTFSAYQANVGSFSSSLRGLASLTVTQMVNEYKAQTSATSLPVAMTFVIDEMTAQSQTVQKCSVGASVVADAGNAGDAVVVFGCKDSNGLDLEYIIPESIAGVCTRDAQSGGAAVGQETITFRGQYAISDTLSNLWPVGSGAAVSVRCIDPSQDASRGNSNYLNNGDFETWTVSDVPDGWTIAVGGAGSTIYRSSVHYDGSYSLNFYGNSTEETAVYQEFGTILASGTTTPVLPLDQMAFNAFVKIDATPLFGVLTFSLVDESDSVILDSQGTPNVVHYDLTTASTDWTAVNGFFRTPRVLPSSTRFMISLSTPLEASKNVYIDRVGFAEPYSFYRGGPVIAAFSASSPIIQGDGWTATTTNDYDGQFQTWFNRVFGMANMGLILPSSGSPSISDSLIS